MSRKERFTQRQQNFYSAQIAILLLIATSGIALYLGSNLFGYPLCVALGVGCCLKGLKP